MLEWGGTYMKGLQTSIHTFPHVTLSKMTFISVHIGSLKSVFPDRFIDLTSCDSSTVTEAHLNVQMWFCTITSKQQCRGF